MTKFICKNELFQNLGTKNEFFKVQSSGTKNEFYAKFRDENNSIA
jgi:hypothetical protein